VNLEEAIRELLDGGEVELDNVTIEAEELIFEVNRTFTTFRPAQPKAALTPETRKAVYKFNPPIKEYNGSIVEVQLGATKADGGSRKKVVKLGGQSTLYRFEGGYTNTPVVSFDVFDTAMPSFPKTLREKWGDVWDDPAGWAREAVKLGTELVTLHLTSTDPRIKDTSPKEAAKTVEDVLQAVKVPLVVGGSGNPEKDPLLFEKIAEAAEGEMLLLASANLDLDFKKIVEAAKKFKHNVLAFTSMNITDQQSLNRLLFEEELPKDRLVQDPTTGALGYGLDYTYSIIERLKQNALKGDEVLQNPVFCGVTNAWAAREAWMNEPKWGAREYRGPLWEVLTAVTVINAGADGMMMLHPEAVRMVKELIESATGKFKGENLDYPGWVEGV
jgi:acetyl-CoA decarbonylase/synthase complex subunit delta